MSLPGILNDVAEVAGLAKALELAREHGGTEISISDADGSVLVRIVGKPAAAVLVERLARVKVVVPMANQRGAKARRARAAELLGSGQSTLKTALACDIHQRTAKRIRAKAKDPLPLFDRPDPDAEG